MGEGRTPDSRTHSRDQTRPRLAPLRHRRAASDRAGLRLIRCARSWHLRGRRPERQRQVDAAATRRRAAHA